MISLVENLSQIENITENDAFGTRIRSIYELYGNKLDTFVWTDGFLAISFKGGVVNLCGEIRDREELLEFLSVISPAAIMCDERLSNALKFDIIQRGEIYGKKSPGISMSIKPINDVRFRELYELFVKNNMELEYESFCFDASFSFRHCGGTAAVIYDKEELVAAAVASSVTTTSAIINAVAVSPNHKRMGLGSKVMEDMEQRLSGRRLFLFKEIGENDVFYSSIGYSKKGIWTVGRLPKQ